MSVAVEYGGACCLSSKSASKGLPCRAQHEPRAQTKVRGSMSCMDFFLPLATALQAWFAIFFAKYREEKPKRNGRLRLFALARVST